mmetsp:Transcript_2501/g.4400  ORF Transcript_2501/g.4400 Transcript_2501/m.4400 type:complete len:169 (+) Transcript_2501:1759-2265(+)
MLNLFSFYSKSASKWTCGTFVDGLEIHLAHFKISSTEFLSRSAYYRNDRYKRNHDGDSCCQNGMIFNTICFLFSIAADIKFIFSSQRRCVFSKCASLSRFRHCICNHVIGVAILNLNSMSMLLIMNEIEDDINVSRSFRVWPSVFYHFHSRHVVLQYYVAFDFYIHTL